MTPSPFETPGPPAQPEPAGQESAGRRGRRPGPIADDVRIAHRGWLEPVRRRLNASGLTQSQLCGRVNYSEPVISQLLRGRGSYPRWQVTSLVGRALDAPMWPMRMLWESAALEADKKPTWIEECLDEAPPRQSSEPRLLRHFADQMREPYTDFARAFLVSDDSAKTVVTETFTILWMCWDLALASSNAHRYAWSLLRARVLPRAALHPDGHPDLAVSALFTQAHAGLTDSLAQQTQLQESIALFDAIGRLPHNPLDTSVLRYLCGWPQAEIPGIVGITPALATVFDKHARQILEADLTSLITEPGETAP